MNPSLDLWLAHMSQFITAMRKTAAPGPSNANELARTLEPIIEQMKEKTNADN